MENYEILKQIGKGTYGTVHLCHSKKHKKQVTIKSIYIDDKKCEIKVANNEIAVLSKLKHPNITKYYDSFYCNMTVFIVMEYASQGTLSNLLANRGRPLVSQDIQLLFSQIVCGLDHIHKKKIIHRDLKCDNIFLGAGLKVKIGDFGISKILASHCTTTVIGTPYYLAPELCQNQPYNTKTDIWALGCLLYEMSSLKRPFEGSTLVGLVHSIMSADVEPINLMEYPNMLWSIITGLLCRSPAKRPTATQLLSHPYICRQVFLRYIDSFKTIF